MPYDPNAAAKYAWQHAHDKAPLHGKCAQYSTNALEYGFGPNNIRKLIQRPENARDFGPSLVQAGFSPMPAGTAPQGGDIIIFPGFLKDLLKNIRKDHTSGHMEIYDGMHKLWISDFKQRRERKGYSTGLFPGDDYFNSGVGYVLYRYGG